MSERVKRVPASRLLALPEIADARGRLSYVDLVDPGLVPFVVKRIFYIYDVPASAARGGHAHRELEQLIVTVSGRFDILVDDGRHRRHFALERPDQGLYVPARVWLELTNFSPEAVCLVLASHCFDESDYWRDYDEFRSTVI